MTEKYNSNQKIQKGSRSTSLKVRVERNVYGGRKSTPPQDVFSPILSNGSYRKYKTNT